MRVIFSLAILAVEANSYLLRPNERIPERGKLLGIPSPCECMPFWLCKNGTAIINGSELIDIRSSAGGIDRKRKEASYECENELEICCASAKSSQDDRRGFATSDAPIPLGLRRNCGIRNFEGIDERIMGKFKGVTKFGEFPWVVAVLHHSLDKLDEYICGGSLIHRKVVLTAAHCVHGKPPKSIKIRAGEWDTQLTSESLPHQDRAVEFVLVHQDFDINSLFNDVALLFLTEAVKIADNVDIVCLTQSDRDFDRSRCIATGWGKDKFEAGGQYQKILSSVELSIVPSGICQNILRNTRLWRKFILDKSFLCALGADGDDTCKGDGGSPLICPLKMDPKRFVQVGVVSWGLSCGSDAPGVYANISHLRTWIDEQLLFHNFDNSVYQY